MSKVLAFLRASWLTSVSYRLSLVFSLGGLVVGFIPLYFVSRALQPVVEDSIRMEGEQYFGFLVVGIAVTYFLGFAMRSLPGAISGGIRSGTLEALLATPTSLPTLLAGMLSYPFVLTTVRASILVLAMAIVGTPVSWGNLPLSTFILALIVLAHIPVGLCSAALHLVFRTSGPLASGVLAASTLLGGVYYSTTVIPEAIQPLAAIFPLTYGLRALRRALLAGEPLSVVGGDLVILGLFATVLLALGLWAFRHALNYARKAGTLAQY
ncbi:MAG: ABC transporter permease [Gemmatimonadota bacterium]